jgi:hypothetical protein
MTLRRRARTRISAPPASRRCRRCKLERLPDETWRRGFCPACRAARSAQRRKATGSKLLARAKAAGTEERNGQTFRIVQLPPNRRGGRRR